MTSPPPPYPGQPGNDFGGMPPYAGGGGPTEPPPAGNGMAIAALVLGLLSIPAAFTVYIGAILGVLGIVFGVLGLSRARRRGGRGRGMAIAGLITALAGLAISVVLFTIGVKELQQCRNEMGANATQSQLRQCIRDKFNR